MSARTTAGPPERRNRIRYPRDFLLEDGAHISWVTTESFESIRGREVTRIGGDGVPFKTKIVEEVTTQDTARKIMETETENITLSPASQDMDGRAGNSLRAREEAAGDLVGREEQGDEEGVVRDEDGGDFLAPCEGTFPVCCAADLTPEFMNHFISRNTIGDMSYLVFVDSLDDYYKDETRKPIQHPSSTSSPFKGKTPHECYLLLRQLVRNTKSRIDWEQSVIVDERSLRDDTIILVTIPPEDGEEVMWVRAASHLASAVLMSCRSGNVSLDEIIEEVHAEQGSDGVLKTF